MRLRADHSLSGTQDRNKRRSFSSTAAVRIQRIMEKPLIPRAPRNPGFTSLTRLLSSVLLGLWLIPARADLPPLTMRDIQAIAIMDTMVMVPMRDGVRLATDIYRPKNTQQTGRTVRLPTILIKTPYSFNKLEGFHRRMVHEAVRRGYALVLQNERGRYYSEGNWEILGRPRDDGYDTLSWIAAQEWSNGKVGTLGCSSSAEWQLALAAQSHPAHKAMVPMAPGSGIGQIGGFYEQGGWYRGGAHQTIMSYWLYTQQQQLRPTFPSTLTQIELQRVRKLYSLEPSMPKIDWLKQFELLPANQWLKRAGANNGPALDMLRRTPADRAWYVGGLYREDETIEVPAFWFFSWFDTTVGPNLALYNHVRQNSQSPAVRDNQYLVVAPTGHCTFLALPQNMEADPESIADLIVGDMNLGKVRLPWINLVFEWFGHFLVSPDEEFLSHLPRVRYFTMGDNRWSDADSWPPAGTESKTWWLDSEGHANSLYGNGVLTTVQPEDSYSDTFTYDPMNPVPVKGGGLCCYDDDRLAGGSFDQRAVEARSDVLVYTSPVLGRDTEITGSVRPILYVQSSAKDTDFTVKLVDVHPDGTAWNIDDTILRARYREGFHKQVFMEPGSIYEIRPSPMTTSYVFKSGHRIRIEISSSKFPQYMRNLNTGGNNVDETDSVVARNSVHHSPAHPSRIVFSVKSEE